MEQQQKSKTVGNYTFIRKLGSGSFAVVYKAHYKHDEKKYVALKAISKHKLNAKTQENLDLEIGILERIDHPNIVKLLGTERTERTIYLVMEYCNGGDLHKFIHKNKVLPPHVVQHLMRDLAAGIKYLWTHRLIHRDLKPQNLLLSTHQSKQVDRSATPRVVVTLKIADFGFARHLAEAGMAETLCGSPLYMAPEILRYEKYDGKADLWSVGAIMYEMLVGRPPYNGSNPRELLQNIERTHVSFPPKVPAECVSLLRELLTRNPSRRIEFADFLRNPFICPTRKSLGDSARDTNNVARQGSQSDATSNSTTQTNFETSRKSNPVHQGSRPGEGLEDDKERKLFPPSESPLLTPAQRFPRPDATIVLPSQASPTRLQATQTLNTKGQHTGKGSQTNSGGGDSEEQWCMVDKTNALEKTTLISKHPTSEQTRDPIESKGAIVVDIQSDKEEEYDDLENLETRDACTRRALAYAAAMDDRAYKLAQLSQKFTNSAVFEELGITPSQLDLPLSDNEVMESNAVGKGGLTSSERIARLCGLSLLVKACELLQAAVMAADDAMDASSVSGGVPHIAACTVASDLRDRFSACTRNARRILRSGLASGSIVPPAEMLMYQIAVKFCERAMEHERKLPIAEPGETNATLDGKDVAVANSCLRYYTLGLFLFELLLVGKSSAGEFLEPSFNDRRVLRGFIATISMRIDKMKSRIAIE